MQAELEAILDTVRPAVRAHGGEVEVAEYDPSTGIVRLKFHGACDHCALAPLTLKLGLEPLLKKEFSWITSVVAE